MLELNREGRKSDWKECLSVEAEQELNQLLEEIKKHRCAYRNAENVQVAQVWCGLVEVIRKMYKLEQRIDYIEAMFKALFDARDCERDKLVKSLMKF